MLYRIRYVTFNHCLYSFARPRLRGQIKTGWGIVRDEDDDDDDEILSDKH